MDLLTDEIKEKFPPWRSTDDQAPKDIKVVVKFFDPCGR